MTHFTVLVVGDDVEEILEPYSENKEVAPYVDKTSDEVESAFQAHKEMVKKNVEDGEKIEAFAQLTLDLEHVNSNWWKQWRGIPLNRKGESMSTYNPDSKWDWYSVGGRWLGSLILKPNATGELGKPGIFGNKPRFENGADECRICDVDWKAMNKAAQESAAKVWDELFTPNPEHCIYNPEYVESQKALHLSLYQNKEEYIRRRGVWTPYAMVSRENGWISPGETGWFGMSSDDTHDRDKFDSEFVKIMKSFPPETRITIVDCHI